MTEYETYFLNYFNGENSICREERQYALFLYIKLLSLINKENLTDDDIYLLRACINLKFNNKINESKIKILSVAYEATFMRDIFEADRFSRFEEFWSQKKRAVNTAAVTIEKYGYGYESIKEFINSYVPKSENYFNVKLLKYIYKDNKSSLPDKIHYNINYANGNQMLEDYCEKAKVMMKAKPDLSIIFEINKEGTTKKYLQFIETKYLSDESRNGENTQTENQNDICKFLCENIWTDLIPVDTLLLRFIGRYNNFLEKSDNESFINISRIIPKELNPSTLKR